MGFSSFESRIPKLFLTLIFELFFSSEFFSFSSSSPSLSSLFSSSFSSSSLSSSFSFSLTSIEESFFCNCSFSSFSLFSFPELLFYAPLLFLKVIERERFLWSNFIFFSFFVLLCLSESFSKFNSLSLSL